MGDHEFLPVLVIFPDFSPLEQPLVHVVTDSRKTYDGVYIRILFVNGSETQTFVKPVKIPHIGNDSMGIATSAMMTIATDSSAVPIGSVRMHFAFIKDHTGSIRSYTRVEVTYYGDVQQTDQSHDRRLMEYTGVHMPWNKRQVAHIQWFPVIGMSVCSDLLRMKS